MAKTTNHKASEHNTRKRISVIRTIAVKERTILYGSRRIDHPQKAAELGRMLVQDADREHLVICCLDVRMQPVSLEDAAIGTATECTVGIREVFKNAILSNAAHIIVLHNHPSGDASPSREDIRITNRIREAGQLLGISLLDHIILGEGEQYTSLAELQDWSLWAA